MGKKIKAFIRRTSLLVLSMMFMACSCMTAFADEKQYLNHTADEWRDNTQSFFLTSILEIDPSTMADAVDYYRQTGMDNIADMYQYWIDRQPSLGDFVEFGEFSINEENNMIYISQVVAFQNDKIEFDVTVDTLTESYDFFMKDYVVETKPLSEVMSKAGMNTLMGVGTVFVVLAVMIILISLFKYVNVLEKSASAKKAEQKQNETPDFVEQISQRESKEDASGVPVSPDAELIAVIAAAIAAATGDNTDSFVVRSIRRR